jgi:hypothetical protein
MTQPLIVFLSGWAGSGKDAAATLLVEERNFMRVAFADALKRDVSHKTDIPLEIFHCARKDAPLARTCRPYPAAKTPRDVLLAHAIKARAADPDVYAKAVVAEIHTGLRLGQHRFVISDWRLQREYEYVVSHINTARFVRAHVTRPGTIQSDDPMEHDGCISDLRDRLRPLVHASSITGLLHE